MFPIQNKNWEKKWVFGLLLSVWTLKEREKKKKQLFNLAHEKKRKGGGGNETGECGVDLARRSLYRLPLLGVGLPAGA